MKFQKSSGIIYPEAGVKDVFFYLWKEIRKHKLPLFLVIFGVFASSVMNIIVPVYYKYFFDALALNQNRESAVQQLFYIITIILILEAITWVFWRIAAFSNVYFEIKTMAGLRQQAYDGLSRHSYSFFANNFTGALVQRVNRYARAFERAMDHFAWDFLPIAVRILGIGIVLWTIKPAISVVILTWTFVYIAVNYFYSKWRLKYNIEMARSDSATTAALADAITNQNNIEVFNRHPDESKRFKQATENQARISLQNWNVNEGLDSIQAGLIILIEFFIFYFSIYYWKDGSITIGTFALIQLYVIGLGEKLWGFSRIIRNVYESYADAKEMAEIMKLPYEIKNSPQAKSLKVSSGEIIFEDVSFSFHKTRQVLNKINIKINQGEKVAIIGPSGAGKTTIIRLMLRFYDLTSGKIMIDGQDIRRVTLESLRENISLVPQEPLLFHRTIMENIKYGKPSSKDTDALEAGRLAHCREFIEKLPDKYETYVGERGIKLSGGERQRVAIARAILKNSPILILDEATSSLDSHSEILIQNALDVLMKNKTVIVIAHRLSTIRKMDRIIVIKNGAVFEEGTHDDLIKKSNSLYAKLWKFQAGGFI
ncbi:MAG: ABC transporter ATP-binding protein [Candidatus Staskawiczbacteria bacterium]|nr:ABC transporter ATP-binding protein [Candidatus Staskawiczbacteria bacterium]